jgi:hypothetical protein
MVTIKTETDISERAYVLLLQEKLNYKKTELRPGDMVRVDVPTGTPIDDVIPTGTIAIITDLNGRCPCDVDTPVVNARYLDRSGKLTGMAVHVDFISKLELADLDQPWSKRPLSEAFQRELEASKPDNDPDGGPDGDGGEPAPTPEPEAEEAAV